MQLPLMRRKGAFFCALLTGAFSLTAHASPTSCDLLNYQDGDLIRVNSAPNLGSRIELPSKLMKAPVITNARRWNVGGEIGTNQLVVAPNSHEKDGAQAMIFAFTESGKVYDILITRSKPKDHTPCVIVSNKPSFIFKPTPPPKPKPKPIVVKKPAPAKPVMPQMFTSYSWDNSSRNYPANLIGSVYDDGRTTFIRLNKGAHKDVAVEARVNKADTLLPVSHDENFTVFSVPGIHSMFNVRIGRYNIKVKRT